MARNSKHVRFSDAPEVNAGSIGAILSLMPVAIAQAAHHRLNSMVLEYEAAKGAWKSAVDRRTKLDDDVKRADADFGAVLQVLPVLAAEMLRITRPAPANTDYTKLDKGVRFGDLLGWIRAGGSPDELKYAQSLEAYRDRHDALHVERGDAEAKEHEAKLAFGNARIRLAGVVRETVLFVRLNAPHDSPALKALTKPRKSKKVEQTPEQPPATTTPTPTPANSDTAPAAAMVPAPEKIVA